MELVDEYPSSVLTHARRQHRWIRGDWQILFWLFPFVPSRRGHASATRCRSSARWKILDNLRRSLVAPMLLALLVAGWTVLPGHPLVLDDGGRRERARVAAAADCSRGCWSGRAKSQSFPVFLRNLRDDALTALAQIVLSVTFLAYHAFDTLHAIGLTLVAPGRHEAPPARVGNGGGDGRARPPA